MKEKIESNIDKDIERCKNLIGFVGCELRQIEANSIENVLKELKKEKAKNLELNIELKIFKQSNKNLLAKKQKLETYKKIAEKLADTMAKEHTNNEYEYQKAKVSIIDWARKEVENEKNNSNT